MNRERFEQLVIKAVDSLPDELRARLENVDLVVEEQPTLSQLAKSGLKRGETLLGLYQGVPLTERGQHYGLVIPDKITIFQKPIEAECRSEAEIMTKVRKVVQHEIAHHFGISDAKLRQLKNGEN